VNTRACCGSSAESACARLEALRIERERDRAVIGRSLALATWQEVSQALGGLVPASERHDANTLVSALRHQGVCTLDEAHALIDLQAVVVRMMAEPDAAHHDSEQLRQIVQRAEQAAARILGTATVAPLHAEYARAAVPAGANAPTPEPATSHTRPLGTPRSSAFVVALLVVCVAAAGVAAVLLSGVGRRDPLSEGIAADVAGQRMVARLAFERALVDNPDDGRPLIYLGRLARDEGDLREARRLLSQAVERTPENPLAHRELAVTLMADGHPELARRFFVRALEIDPTDRVAQGFLGCALRRVGRGDEARRWFDRAGPGDWSGCANEPARVPGTP
jgi:cytochrome c-type biogenesis protein CcmH/NrfG